MTLDDILKAVAEESKARENRYPLPFVRRKVEKMPPTRGFAQALRRRPFSIIAEIKRKSPSMGTINPGAINAALSVYSTHEAVSAISVLTQEKYFGGTPRDLEDVKRITQGKSKPILRKDFIFSEYEVYYSRMIGADAILLMANVIDDKKKFRALHELATSIGLDVLCEIHEESEIELLPETVSICGINSRRFKGVRQASSLQRRLEKSLPLIFTSPAQDTTTDTGTFALFKKLQSSLGDQCLKVAESGISAENIGTILKTHPFNAALIGTSILKSFISDMPLALDKLRDAAYDAVNARIGVTATRLSDRPGATSARLIASH